MTTHIYKLRQVRAPWTYKGDIVQDQSIWDSPLSKNISKSYEPWDTILDDLKVLGSLQTTPKCLLIIRELIIEERGGEVTDTLYVYKDGEVLVFNGVPAYTFPDIPDRKISTVECAIRDWFGFKKVQGKLISLFTAD
jgi:hypothetical protein